jgi:hypothetical protein
MTSGLPIAERCDAEIAIKLFDRSRVGAWAPSLWSLWSPCLRASDVEWLWCDRSDESDQSRFVRLLWHHACDRRSLCGDPYGFGLTLPLYFAFRDEAGLLQPSKGSVPIRGGPMPTRVIAQLRSAAPVVASARNVFEELVLEDIGCMAQHIAC